MKKQFAALIAAILMTTCIALAILAVGGAALFNPNGTTASNSHVQASQITGANTPQDAQVQQLQSLIAQYQSREQQYQAREKQYQEQLDQANAQVRQLQEQMQQAQFLLQALQQRGLITITSDGRIFINQ